MGGEGGEGGREERGKERGEGGGRKEREKKKGRKREGEKEREKKRGRKREGSKIPPHHNTQCQLLKFCCNESCGSLGYLHVPGRGVTPVSPRMPTAH